MMKKVEAIIKPFKLDDVKEALNAIGIQGMTGADHLSLPCALLIKFLLISISFVIKLYTKGVFVEKGG